MALRRLPYNWPVIVLRLVNSFGELQSLLKQWARSEEQFRREVSTVINNNNDLLEASTGSGAPASTPSQLGLHYVDTSAKEAYISVGTASSADWKQIT